MNLLVLDFETFYSKEYSLRRISTPEYILDPRFEVFMLAAWDVKSWPAPRIIDGPDVPAFLQGYDPETTIAVAHNALFDMAICSWRYGWVPKLMQDTLGMARALCRFKKNDLGSLAEKLLGHNSKGGVLGKTVGMSAQQIKQAGLWPEMRTYAMNDVRLCAQIYSLLTTGDARKGIQRFPVEERYIMDLVLRTTVQPVFHVNVPMLQSHLDDLRARKRELLDACGYDKAALMSTLQFQEALEKLGVEIEMKTSATGRQVPAFAKTDKFMADLLENEQEEVQALAAARLSHKSTIEETRSERFLKVAQLPWMNGCRYPHCDGGPATGYCHVNCREHPNLIPMPLRYGGAHTHRLSGEWKMNCQNLTRSQKESKLRTALIAPPGHKIVAADLSQIEARMVAVLARQGNLIEQFARGEDVYSNFGSAVFGRKINKRDDPNERFISKTAVLGLGYGCGWTKFHKMVMTSARQYKIPVEGIFDEQVAQKTVTTYRGMFSQIPALWYALDTAKDLIFSKSQSIIPLGPIKITGGRIILPSGLDLTYDDVDREDIWGGVLTENISQALARIVIMQTAVRLHRLGYRFILQAHDELVFCVREAELDEAKKVIMQEMVRPVPWLPELPLAAEMGIGDNYGECK